MDGCDAMLSGSLRRIRPTHLHRRLLKVVFISSSWHHSSSFGLELVLKPKYKGDPSETCRVQHFKIGFRHSPALLAVYNKIDRTHLIKFAALFFSSTALTSRRLLSD